MRGWDRPAGVVGSSPDSPPEESGSETRGPRYMADAFETSLVARLAFAFLPERPTRSQGGTDGSNPLSSSGESRANLSFRSAAGNGAGNRA
jgi:hypothetical protein